MPTIETIAYGGWQHCTRIANSAIEVIITNEVGPRVIRCGFIGGANQFCEVPEDMGQTGGDKFRLYGGHRLWHAPEHPVRTNVPDNQPVEVTQAGSSVRFRAGVEATTGIQKQMEITVSDARNEITIVHQLTNHNLWDVELAPWALSVMTTGGTAVVPLPPHGSHSANLLPTHTFTFWAYTEMADPRWTWGNDFILLRQDVNAQTPQKLGIYNTAGWLGYVNNGVLFVKKYDFDAQATYPDRQSPCEIFTNDFMLELETLAPWQKLAAGATAVHRETWSLYQDVPTPENDADVKAGVLPRIV